MMPISNTKKEQSKEKKLNIDINCDLAQSYGVYKSEIEQNLLPYVSSVNIACGLHAGDPLTIMNALKTASEKNLFIGAHVGYPDIQGFGYRSMYLSIEEMQALIVYQIGALSSLAKLYNLNIEYVRPHGALYKQMAEDYNICLSIAKAISSYNQWMVLVGPPCENLIKAGEETNIRVSQEIQLDKIYNVDGGIDFDAGDINELDYSVKVLNSLVKSSTVPNNQGGHTKMTFNTIHLSMKSDMSLEIAKKTREFIPSPIPITGTFVADSGWLNE